MLLSLCLNTATYRTTTTSKPKMNFNLTTSSPESFPDLKLPQQVAGAGILEGMQKKKLF